jgi:hypothetical protein
MASATLKRPPAATTAGPERTPIPPLVEPHHPMPVRGSDETLKIYVQTGGKTTIVETLAQIAAVDGRIKATLKALTDGTDPGQCVRALESFRTQRAVYTARITALDAILGVKTPVPDALSLPDLAGLLAHAKDGASVRSALEGVITKTEVEHESAADLVKAAMATFGDPAALARAGDGSSHRHHFACRAERRAIETRADLVRLNGQSTYANSVPETHQYELDVRNLVREIGGIPYHALSGGAWAVDAAIAKMDAALARQKDAKDKLTALKGDHAQAKELVAKRVRAAVEQAGGNAAIVEGLESALRLANKWLESSPQASDIGKLRATIAGRESEMAKVAPDSKVFQRLATDLSQVTAKLDALIAEAQKQRTAEITALVSSAMDGAEDARAAIEQTASKTPAAFPDGFVDAIRNARFERAVYAELAPALS